MQMNQIRRGHGLPLLLLHGLGGTWRSWRPILGTLAVERHVIAVDLPGFGKTPPLNGSVSIETLADAVTEFLYRNDLLGIDVAGSSMGARLVLELARRGVVGSAVALDPGGFWEGWEKQYFLTSLGLSIRLIRLLESVLPLVTSSRIGRSILLAQLSAKPWAVPPDIAEEELRGYARSKSFNELLSSLINGPAQLGIPAGSISGPIAIGWGRQDRVCLPRQAARAMDCFPMARLHWFENCGHFPHWDAPAEAAQFILDNSGLNSETLNSVRQIEYSGVGR